MTERRKLNSMPLAISAVMLISTALLSVAADPNDVVSNCVADANQDSLLAASPLPSEGTPLETLETKKKEAHGESEKESTSSHSTGDNLGKETTSMSRLVLSTFALGRQPWTTFDPFLFCVYHNDMYPAGGDNLGPDPRLLRGRNIGSDFSYQDGWSMYHGDTVPGFPEHPHRGFETITVTRRGIIDHFDSLGAKGRYGHGDTQWMTAGKGVQHCEMFPLLNKEGGNPLELFQIWINLPAKSKFVDADYVMFWDENTPTVTLEDGKSTVRVIAGDSKYFSSLSPELKVPAPPTASYASKPSADVAVWEVKVPEGSSVTLPAAFAEGANRAVYFFDGKSATVGETPLRPMNGARVDSSQSLTLSATGGDAQFLVLQGKPIGEPVAQHGPFVMNTQEEIMQAFADFRKTQFGGWPFNGPDPNNGADPTRFATHSDGSKEMPKHQKF